MTDVAYQQCMSPACAARYAVDDVLFSCRRCHALVDVAYDWSRCRIPSKLSDFAARWSTAGRTPAALADFSGVWRFRELLPFAEVDQLTTIGEGRTLLQQADDLARAIGGRESRLFLQYEGFNPSGSFKDNGMAAAFTMAGRLGRARVACASTGNTSASLALYAGQARSHSGKRMRAVVFVGGGKIAFGKLAQALDFGATTVQIDGDFDACMKLIQDAADRLKLYVMNSVNPFRLEGQKAIMYRVLEGLNWEVPDWIIVPGGNLGNSSAFGKAFLELKELGLVARVPRLAIINAAGANTLFELYHKQGLRFDGGRYSTPVVDAYYDRLSAEGRAAKTVATAIEIARPVNLPKALRALEAMDGVVREVTDEEILDAKALIGRHGYGCEPASAASLAGLRRLWDEQVISRSERVVCILTGHALKDPNATVEYHGGEGNVKTARAFANPPIRTAADVEAIAKILESLEA